MSGRLDGYFVVNCFKMCIFVLAHTTVSKGKKTNNSCELLQNVYLCISTYNSLKSGSIHVWVVNCFKMCIFVLARTTYVWEHGVPFSCELLQNVYLCISTYNQNDELAYIADVVNCFKMCIFVLARTTRHNVFHVSRCCELLQNVYLCISTYNVCSNIRRSR